MRAVAAYRSYLVYSTSFPQGLTASCQAAAVDLVGSGTHSRPCWPEPTHTAPARHTLIPMEFIRRAHGAGGSRSIRRSPRQASEKHRHATAFKKKNVFAN
eukprot:GHVT01005671.1.p6 GENE.GHVT01005671.1~~GHVT01005671.1.p6  ORF type:complete len:100 (-),score=17.75 GHVT01005671.1:1016-1315(-)